MSRDLDGAVIEPTYGAYDESDAYHRFGRTNAEEGAEMSKGPSITQEQLSLLEVELTRHQHPNTESKKALADSLGLGHVKVNVSYRYLNLAFPVDPSTRIGIRIDEQKRNHSSRENQC